MRPTLATLLVLLAATPTETRKRSRAQIQAAWLANDAPLNLSTGRTIVSESPLIELDETFLTAAEIGKLDELSGVVGTPWVQGQQVAGMDRGALGPGGWFKMFDLRARHYQQGAAMGWLDKKVWQWTGIRPHPNETLKMSLMTPDPANPERDGASVVHIDVNRAPFRQKTVIAYLTEVSEKGGGATVFPCIVPGGGEKLVRKRRAMCEAMATNHLASASEGEDPFGLWAAADGICHGKAAGLKIQPQKGRAIVFDVADSDTGLPEPMTYHAACSVSSGLKMNLQVFKELSVQDRGPAVQATAAEWNPGGLQQEGWTPQEMEGRVRQDL